MSARQLEEGYWRANRRFYSLSSIPKRLTPDRYSLKLLPFNLCYAWCVRRRLQPQDYFF